MAGPAGPARHGRPDRRRARGQRPARRLLRLRPAARRPGEDGPRGVGARRRVRLLQRHRLQPDERARPHRPLHLPRHRPALEDHRRRARGPDPVHRRAHRHDRQRRPGHHVRLERAVLHRALPDPARVRHLGPVHPGLRPRRPRPGPPLLAERRAHRHRARHLGGRPLRPGRAHRRRGARADVSDDACAAFPALAGVHGRPAPVGVGYVTRGGTTGTEVTSASPESRLLPRGGTLSFVNCA
ncbi:conserved hypothetical protein [Streptomyces misionensis JCM 4497]